MATQAGFRRAERWSPFQPNYKRVPGEGPQPSKLVLIGERPGQEEARRGRPFVGPAGEILNTCLTAANLDRKSIYITNLVKTFREYDKPTESDIAEGMGELLTEIEACQPEVIGLLGTFAVEAILQRDRAEMEKTHGVPVRYENSLWLAKPAIAMPIVHPAAGIHSPDAMANVLDDFLRLGQLLDGELHLREDEHIGKEDYQRTDRTEITAPVVAIDTEGSEARPWCLTWSQIPGWARLSKVGMQVNSRKVYLHNALHDLGVLRAMGIELTEGQYVDTMVLAYQLCIEPQGLKALAYRHCGMDQQDYIDLIRGPNREKALEFFVEMLARSWPDPEPYIVQEAGKPKIKKPWNISRLAKRALDDIVSNKRDKDGNPPDLRKRWHNWDDAVRQPVIDLIGDMPEATLDDVPPDVAEHYACRDADATLRIGPILEQRIKDMGLEESAAVDHAILPMIDRMQTVGIQLAPPAFWDEIERQCEAQMGRAKYQIYKLTGAEINPASGDQVAALLYDQLKLTPPKMTDSGSRGSTKDEYLEELLPQAPVVEHVMDYREADKVRGTYCLPLRKIAAAGADGDGRVHATFRVTRVSSGRLAASDPNVLAVPVRSGLGKNVRAGFVAREGYVLGDWDLNQIEMRLMASESRDENLCRAYQNDADIHTETAARAFGVKESQVEPYQRQAGKVVGFGIINGISEKGLVVQMIKYRARKPNGDAWTEDDCRSMLDAWFSLRPGVKRFQQACVDEARATGLARESITGRIRYLPAVWSPIRWIREEAERQTYSHRIQSGAQAIIKKAMAVIWREIRGMRGEVEPLLQVHDELLFEVLDSSSTKEYVDAMMHWALCETTKLRVPVKASGGFGVSWLEAH